MEIVIIIILVFILVILVMLMQKIEKKQEEFKSENIQSLLNLRNDINISMLKSFSEVSSKLSRVDEAQKNIDKLSSNIMDFQKILTDKKTRGIFGEIQLNQVLENIFGQGSRLYDLQYTMNEKKIVDAIVFAPKPLGEIPIDSKFPLENFKRMEDGENTRVSFLKDVKQHIDDISEKYVENQNVTQAIMFIPAEKIYTYILMNEEQLMQYAYRKKVWIAGPMNLMVILSNIQMVFTNIQRNDMAEKLHLELISLEPEFKRYKERWDNISKDVDKLLKDIKEIDTTTKKIGDRFEKIRDAKE